MGLPRPKRSTSLLPYIVAHVTNTYCNMHLSSSSSENLPVCQQPTVVHTDKKIYASKFRESMYDFKGNKKESHSGNGFFAELVNAELKGQQLGFEKRMCAIGVEVSLD